jgi:hypothetical protein
VEVEGSLKTFKTKLNELWLLYWIHYRSHAAAKSQMHHTVNNFGIFIKTVFTPSAVNALANRSSGIKTQKKKMQKTKKGPLQLIIHDPSIFMPK